MDLTVDQSETWVVGLLVLSALVSIWLSCLFAVLYFFPVVLETLFLLGWALVALRFS